MTPSAPPPPPPIQEDFSASAASWRCTVRVQLPFFHPLCTNLTFKKKKKIFLPPDGKLSANQSDCMLPAERSDTSCSLSSHRAAAALWSCACADGRQRKQLLKYMPPRPSSSGATAQYTVVAAPCCCGDTGGKQTEGDEG